MLASWLKGTLSLALIILLIAFLLLLANVRFFVRSTADEATAGAEVRTAIAEVTGVTYRPAMENDPVPETIVFLKVNGQRVTVETRNPPRIGETVRIQYKIGTSGQIYADRILSD